MGNPCYSYSYDCIFTSSISADVAGFFGVLGYEAVAGGLSRTGYAHSKSFRISVSHLHCVLVLKTQLSVIRLAVLMERWRYCFMGTVSALTSLFGLPAVMLLQVLRLLCVSPNMVCQSSMLGFTTQCPLLREPSRVNNRFSLSDRAMDCAVRIDLPISSAMFS